MYSQSVVRGSLLVMHLIFPISILVLYAPLIALLFQILAGGFAVTAVRADEGSESAYPGRYVANCKPAPGLGCVCVTDPAGPTPQQAQGTTEVGDPNGRVEDIEYLRMLEWVRRTCIAVTQPGSLR
jgi:hypothetical protein